MTFSHIALPSCHDNNCSFQARRKSRALLHRRVRIAGCPRQRKPLLLYEGIVLQPGSVRDQRVSTIFRATQQTKPVKVLREYKVAYRVCSNQVRRLSLQI